MSHIAGTYTYDFVRLEPFFNNSNKTGISALVVGMNCQFSGTNEFGSLTTEGAYIDGTTGLGISTYESGTSGAIINTLYMTPEYLTDNISNIANEYASGQCWCHSLSGQILSRIEAPIRDLNFPYPIGQAPDVFPPVNPHDM